YVEGGAARHGLHASRRCTGWYGLNGESEPPGGTDRQDDQARSNESGTKPPEPRNWLASRPVTPRPPCQPEYPAEQSRAEGAERRLTPPRQCHDHAPCPGSGRARTWRRVRGSTLSAARAAFIVAPPSAAVPTWYPARHRGIQGATPTRGTGRSAARPGPAPLRRFSAGSPPNGGYSSSDVTRARSSGPAGTCMTRSRPGCSTSLS